MMCKTGCGAETGGTNMCGVCSAVWSKSPEHDRFMHYLGDKGPRRVALVDFWSRLRAERLNGGHGEAR